MRSRDGPSEGRTLEDHSEPTEEEGGRGLHAIVLMLLAAHQ